MMKKNSIEYLVKEEFNIRLNNMNAITMDKIETSNTLQNAKILKTENNLIGRIKDQSAYFEEQIRILDVSSEIEDIDKKISQNNLDMELCLKKEDATKIWKYMQRFPDYQDLKDLNNKFLPELAKIELQIFKFQVEVEKIQMIITEFDEALSRKGMRTEIDILFKKMTEEYYEQGVINDIESILNAKIAIQEKKYVDLLANIKNISDNLPR